jgi:hypothetical protein
MKQLFSLMVLAMVVLLAAPSSYAAPIGFVAHLTNAQENPPVQPTTGNPGDPPGAPSRVSFGEASLVFDDTAMTLTYNITVFGIDFTAPRPVPWPNVPEFGLPPQTPYTNDDLRVAHIHAGPNVPPANNPVVFGFIGAPYDEDVIVDIVVTPFTTGVGGTVSGKWDASEGNNTTLGAQLANILAGRAYVNFHTVQFTGGEIRGQIVTPEPSTLLLLGSGLAAVIVFGRKRLSKKV